MLKKVLKFFARVITFVIAVPIIMNLIVIFWSGMYIRSAEEVPEAEAILVLGAGVWGNSVLSPMLQDRVDRAITLYEAGKAPKLLMSGDHSSVYYDEVTTMKKYAVGQGVRSGDIFLDHSGFSTYESMIRAREIFGAKKLIIVTQRYHLYRAVFIARALGIDACGVASDPRKYVGEAERQLREAFARVKDFVQVWLPAEEYNGKIDLTGDGDVTNVP